MNNFREFFYESCKKYENSYAFRYNKNEREAFIDYKKYYSDIVNTANVLYRICDQENVVLIGRNSYDYVRIIAACLCGAGKLFLVDGDSSEETLELFLKETRTKVLLYDYNYEFKAKEMKRRIERLNIYKIENFKQAVSEDDSFVFSDYSMDEMRVVFSTSGTTQGNRKKVMLSGRTLLNNMLAANEKSFYEISKVQHLQLLILPLFHIFALSCVLLRGIYVGDTIYISNSPNSLEKELMFIQPHYIFAVPSILEFLLKRYKEKILSGNVEAISEYFGKNLFCFICGGARINPDMVKEYSSIGIRVIRGYGMSEAGPAIAITNSYTEAIDWENLGFPVCHEVKIINSEVCIRGEDLMLGYYLEPELTEKSYEGGWFHTGDAGYISKEGVLYITGRIKNVIVLSSGKKIVPEEVEEQINFIKGVTECGILSLDDKTIMICIYCENIEEEQNNILEEIDAWNRKQPLYKKIMDVVIGDIPLPRTATNKLMRTELPDYVKVMKTVDKLREILVEQMYYKTFITSKEVLAERLGFDSYEMISLIALIEEKFHCDISIEEFLEQKTLLDLGKYICKISQV